MKPVHATQHFYFLDLVTCLDLSAKKAGKCGLTVFIGRRGKGFNEQVGSLCQT